METQKAFLRKKNRAGEIRHPDPDFRLYYKATIIKTVQYWHKKKKTQKYRLVEQDKKLRNKPLHLDSPKL